MSRKQPSAVVLPFKPPEPPKPNRFDDRSYLIASLFMRFGAGVHTGEIDLDADETILDIIQGYSGAAVVICDMPDEMIDRLLADFAALDGGGHIKCIMRYVRAHLAEVP